MDIIIKGSFVYSSGQLIQNDVHIKNGVIARISPDINNAESEIINAEGMVLSPGFTDLHTHLRQPGFEYKETIATGTAAAAAGGFTTVCSMPNLKPVPENFETLKTQLDIIKSDACVRVIPYGALSCGQQGNILADIPQMADYVAGFTDDGRGLQDSGLMEKAMELAAKSGRMIAAHCEVESLLPGDGVCIQQDCKLAQQKGWEGVSNLSESQEVQRDIQLAGKTGCRIHICHTSAAESFEHVRQAQLKGIKASCEVTPHNLVFCCEDIADEGRFKMNPPLRTAKDRQAALDAILDGTAQAIATDHAPHTIEEKEGGFAKAMNGVVGLETAFPALYTHLVQANKISVEKLIFLLTEGPAKILNTQPNTLSEGVPADLVLLDTGTGRVVDPATFKTKGRATPFAGQKLYGWPVMTLCGGKIVYRII